LEILFTSLYISFPLVFIPFHRWLQLDRNTSSLDKSNSGPITHILVVFEVVGAGIDPGESEQSLAGPIAHGECPLEAL